MGVRITRFALALAGLFCTNLSADSFNIAGTVTVTENTMTWTSNVSPFTADQATIGPGPTGIYSALGGTTATIDDLSVATEPVGTAFVPTLFLSFDANPTLSPLDINFISAGIDGSAGCAASTPAAGQLCTPSLPGFPSAFNFSNDPLSQSTATWDVSGVSADGLESWSGMFTSQFTVPFQTVLGAFAPGGSGSVTNSYSATINVSEVSAVPEPSTICLLMTLVLGLAWLARKRRTTSKGI